MASSRINFTKAALENAKLPEQGKRHYYYDTKESGLVMSVTPNGVKTFFLYRKIQGKPERVMLGRLDDLKNFSIENIRKLAAQAKGEIALGGNPQDKKRAMRDEIPFGELCVQFIERHAKLHKKSWKEDVRDIENFLSDWKERKISTIKKTDLQRLHAHIGAHNGIYAANRLLERIRVIFNKAREWGWEGENPAVGIQKFREKTRDRFLQPDELPSFFKALEKEENETARDYIMLSLLTGARKTNVLSMRWDEVNFTQGLWRIPETKNGESQTIPLTKEAMEILDRRKKTVDNDTTWVFPGTGKTGYLQDPKKAWKRILKRAEIKDLRLHDLRRTMGSYQAATGANSFIIGKSLGHKSMQATQIYARLNLDPVRSAFEKATGAMMQFYNAQSSEQNA